MSSTARSTSTQGPSRSARAGYSGALRRHPEYPALAVCLLAWILLTWIHTGGEHSGLGSKIMGTMDAVSTQGGSATAHAHATMDAGSAHGAMDGMSMPGLASRSSDAADDASSLADLRRGWSELPFWVLMCVATMIPVAVPAVRHVAANSLRRRRQRAIAGFLLAYLGLWVVFGAVALPALEALGQATPRWPTILAGSAIVVVWQLLPLQAELRRRCHQTVPLPPRGWRAHLGCLRFGSHHGLACLAVCGPLMVLMALLLHSGLLWMIALSAAIVVIRLFPGSPPLAAANRAVSNLYYRLRWS